MSHRLFFALLPANSLIKQFRTVKKKLGADLPLIWTSEENLHVTVIPPFYHDSIEKVSMLLRSHWRSVNAINLTFRKIIWNKERNPSMIIWEADFEPQLGQLKKHVSNVLHLPPEHRAFKIHMTIAKFAAKDHEDIARILQLPQEIQGKEMFTTLTLMESKLRPQGADYTPQARFLLI